MTIGRVSASGQVTLLGGAPSSAGTSRVGDTFATVFDAVELVPITSAMTNSSLSMFAKTAEASLQASFSPMVAPTRMSMVEAIQQMAYKTATVSVATTGLTLATMASTSIKKNLDLALNQR